jgi:HD-GYP domain-containing protein (c-di-GMP phosphodiesterase class II)
VAEQTDRAHVRLAELVAALSLGIDLGFGQPMEHVLRQCLIALRLAERAGLDEESRAVIYYSALLVDVGCHTDAHEQAKWFGDDIALKSTKYDYELRSVRGAVAAMRLIGSGNPPLHRFRVGLEFAISGHREVDEMIAHHAAMARMLGEQLELSGEVLDAIATAYEQWDGRGWPNGIKGEDVPLAARVAQIAEFIEVAYRVGGADAARELARKRGGKQFDPSLARLVHAEADMLLAGLDEVGTWDAVIEAEPALAVMLSAEGFDAALLAIGNFVDLKSPYTLGHARAVADLAAEAGAQVGLSDDAVRTLRRAGLAHGLGRLGISNSIWDKRGSLGAADAYQAMREPRPHRPARSPEEAAAELRAEVRAGRLDAEAVEAVLGAAGHRVARRRGGPAGLTAREVDVLRLLARGLSNKEIAQILVITPKTVGNHVEHIYSKIDASTRAAAGLFAMRHGLLPEEEFEAAVPA